MRNVIFLLLLATITFSCSYVGQFTEPIEELVSAWEETTQTVNNLTAKVAAEQTNLTQLMESIPPTGQLTTIRENYLDERDQLRAKLAGYKSSFDNLTNDVLEFGRLWEEKGVLVNQLAQNLTEGKLPVDILNQTEELKTFLMEGNVKITGWEKETDEIIVQSKKAAEAFRNEK